MVRREVRTSSPSAPGCHVGTTGRGRGWTPEATPSREATPSLLWGQLAVPALGGGLLSWHHPFYRTRGSLTGLGEDRSSLPRSTGNSR